MDEIALLERLIEAFPDPDPERVDTVRARLVEQWDGARTSTRRRVTRRRAFSAVAAAAAAVLALVLPVILPNGGPGGAERAAANALRLAAVAAARGLSQPPPRPGQYAYTKSRSVQTLLYIPGHGLANFSFARPLAREAWIGPDGSGRDVETVGEASFPTAQDRAAWVAAGSPDVLAGAVPGRAEDHTYRPGTLYFLDLSGLPTDSEALLAVIRERKIVGGPDGDWETFRIIGDLLRETYAPPQLRAALYRVAAELVGVEYVGEVTDTTGRSGIAVAYTHEGIRDELIFDPDDARLLGERTVLVDPDEVGIDLDSEAPNTIIAAAGRPGTVVNTTVYLASLVVDSVQERP